MIYYTFFVIDLSQGENTLAMNVELFVIILT